MTEAMTDPNGDPSIPEPMRADPRREQWLHHRQSDPNAKREVALRFWSTFALFLPMLVLCNLIAMMLIGFWVISTGAPYGSIFWNDFVIWGAINIVAVCVSLVVAICIQRSN